MKNPYTFANLKRIKWGVAEENDPISLYPCMLPGWEHIIEKTGAILGKPQRSIICLHEGTRGTIFLDHKEWTALGQYVLRKILRTPTFALRLSREIIKGADELVSFTKKIFIADLEKKTSRELIQLYRGFENRHGDLYARAIIPVYLDFYKPHLTKYLVEYLKERIGKTHYDKNAKECFAWLTVTDRPSQVQLEEKSLMRIALAGQKRAVGNMLQKHIAAYEYLGYNFEGPQFPKSYFLKRLRELKARKGQLKVALAQMNKDKRHAQRMQERITEDLRIDYRHKQLFQITREIIFGKDYRKMALVKSYYQIEPLLKEFARRTHLSLREVRNCLPHELGDILQGQIKRPKDLAQRVKGCLFVVVDRSLPGKIAVGKLFSDMKAYLHRKEDFAEIGYFHGQTAFAGKARGKVRVINTLKDLAKMRKGNILVSQMTNPNLIPAMKKAAAIITDQGGVTCHAAIVSRELRIPCVIGTKIATKALKDGDSVFVDADQGEVRKI